jgi:polyferredoxin
MLGTYALAAVYFPSIYYTRMFPNLPSGTQVPVLGWSMGIGSAPLGPSVFLVVFLTYVAVGAASVLFGRRVICSVFCTAAVMYQGTAIDTMRSFNRSSPVARKFLGSRFSSAYSAILGITMGSLVVASFTSYLDQIGVLHLTIAGTDPTVFLFALYFGVVWYALFVMIPYAGTYNCVTMGWCYTGAISQAFSRLGFFRLKAKDPNICRQCTTLDCAKACPIGLVDMPGHFRTKGEFRSSKCCGVGNCVGACPYGNLYIHDVRHWLRDRIGARGRPHGTVELPMVRARTASSAGPASSALRTSAGTPVQTQGPRPRGTGSFVPARSTKGGNPD